jgi:hypothetical protein
MSNATPTPKLDLVEFLTAIADDLDRAEEARAEKSELVSVGRRGILDDLMIELHAECASRGIDWLDLLAAATRRCLAPASAVN